MFSYEIELNNANIDPEYEAVQTLNLKEYENGTIDNLKQLMTEGVIPTGDIIAKAYTGDLNAFNAIDIWDGNIRVYLEPAQMLLIDEAIANAYIDAIEEIDVPAKINAAKSLDELCDLHNEFNIVETRAAEKLPLVSNGLPTLLRSYSGEINPAIAPWHTYIADAGHSVFAILSEHEDQAFNSDPTQYLMPIPVKSVMRGYELRDGYIIACASQLKYDQSLGLICPSEDDEF